MSNYEPEKTDYPQTQADLPKKGLYTFWLVVGFVTGVLWGLLSLSPYSKMNKAIKDNDPYEAWPNAKKVRMFALIGIGVNVLFLLFSAFARN
ncbi:MAG: hypothetical protein K6F61_03740 [Clostridiales bacterium]|nr:hypothetical protein [Clostridiales bacterium]